jgi:bifunctional non-homologous end joining protein LigD
MTAYEPMKAADLKQAIDWDGPDPFAGIAAWLTPEWAAEPKIDGCRALLELRAGRSRFGGLRSSSFPALAGINLPALAGTVLDGEFLAPALPGYDQPLLNHSAALFNSGPVQARKWLMYGPPRFIVFDVLAYAGRDVTRRSYTSRRRFLRRAVAAILKAYPRCGVELIEQIPATPAAIEAVLAGGGEGVMLKRRAGRYQPGSPGKPVRSDDWQKVKGFATADCWLTGEYKPGKNSRAGTVGAVEVAVTGGDGAALIVGHVAVKPEWIGAVTGSDGGLRDDMTGTVIEVMAQSVGVNGLFRHPHMVRVRPDKSPGECGPEQLGAFPRA